MSAEPIGSGDLVEFIGPRLDVDPPIGSIWACEGVEESVGVCDTCGEGKTLGLWLSGLHDKDMPWPWCSNHFRPISRRADFARTLEALKAPRDDVPAPTEREPATA